MEIEPQLQAHTSQKSALRIVDDKSDKSLTDDELLNFVNNELFPPLKKLKPPYYTPIKQAVDKQLRLYLYVDLGNYKKTDVPQVISFTSPTSAGKTIIPASLVESVYNETDEYPAQSDTAQKIVDAFRQYEGESIPTEIIGEDLNNHKLATLTVKGVSKIPKPSPSSHTLPTSDDGLFVFANNTSQPTESVTNLNLMTRQIKLKASTVFNLPTLIPSHLKFFS